MSNKLICISAGGAGISLAEEVIKNVAVLGDGFIEIDNLYIDTSVSNIEKIEHDSSKFFKVSNTGYDKVEINGSGGERRHNAAHAEANVNEFLKKYNINKHVDGVFYMVMFSASGGSGSVLGSVIVKKLLEKKLPVIAVVVGDSSNAMYNTNTLNTLAGLNKIAKMTDSTLSIIYTNNHNYNGGIDEKVAASNKELFNTIGTLSMFLSGVHKDLDNQDLYNIINQRLYKTINIQPGVYGLLTYTGKVALPDKAIPTVGRTLSDGKTSPDIDVKLLHHKTGVVTEANPLEVYNGQFPIHLVAYGNFFLGEEAKLKSHKESYDNIMNNIIIEDIEIDGEEDDGLVF